MKSVWMALVHSDSQMGQPAQENTADADYEALITRGTALRPRINVALTALLGEGSFGAVYEAAWRDGHDEPICVKRIRLAGLPDAALRQLRREVCLHAELALAPLLAEAVFHLPVVDAVLRTKAHDQDHVVMQALAACSSK